MYNTIIVDDEPIIRNGIEQFIDWKALNCQVVASVSDGNAALKEFNQDIDILITDIRMPGIDGLDLIDTVIGSYPDTKIIILTGYSDFSYAQKAIQYGVVDYVIKSNPLDKIREAVIKAISQIEAKKKQEHMITALEEKVAENLNDLQSKLLIDLINNSFLSENEKRRKAEAFHINKAPHFTLVFKIIPNENCIDDEARNRFLQSLNNFLMLSFKEYSPKALVLSSKTICLVVHLLASYTESIKIISDICHQVVDMTEQLMHFSMKIGISNQYDDIFLIDKSFKEAYLTVSQSSDANSSVIFYYPEKESQKFIHGERNVLVENAKEYIKANYSNKIELQDIAGHVHLNPSYLSRTFKRVTGDSIVNYITKYRIEKSKEMLTSSDCKLSTIAEKVGINDTSYFSNTFKKITGYSPSEFKFKFAGKTDRAKIFEDTFAISESDE